MKTIDRFVLADEETAVAVTLTTVGPVTVGLETSRQPWGSSDDGERRVFLFSPDEAHRLGQALLDAYGDATGAQRALVDMGTDELRDDGE